MPKTKILLVEDEPMVRKVCEMVLRARGFDPIVATNGMDGLTAYHERHDEICLVLSDVSMPVMGGVEMARKIFESHDHANVILMSGDTIRDLVPAEVRRLCSVVRKPFTPAGLIEAVEKCLKYDEEHYPSLQGSD